MDFRFSAAAILFAFLVMVGPDANAAPAAQPSPDSRCAVCGMFVAKYPNWLTQIRHVDGAVQWFDGAKDMLAYSFDPAQYGHQSRESIAEILVKDYYSLKWVDGRQAFYVTGSDVTGPMGHELVPFAFREAAEAFMKDHHGDGVWAFTEITPEKVQTLRGGHMMKGGAHMEMKGPHQEQQMMPHK